VDCANLRRGRGEPLLLSIREPRRFEYRRSLNRYAVADACSVRKTHFGLRTSVKYS
jgi:hypothetical protein